jgi:decaprenylphospho-beta-D-erythro-pentofuranosid-2-ulose 2-reductase
MNDALGNPQSALVLGGTSEIALATMKLLADRRCRRVVLACRDTDGLAAVNAVARLQAAGAEQVHLVSFDASDPATVSGVVGEAVNLVGDLDLVLLAFGVLGSQEQFNDDSVGAAAAVTVTYTAAVVAGLEVAKLFRRQGHGTLVVLSSVAGERARQDNYVYGSAKAGLDAFAQGLGDSLVGVGARVMVVRPGFVHTRMTAGLKPAPFATSTAVVAATIVRGLESGAEVVWAPGVLRWVFTVLRHLPRGVWRRLSAR